MRRILGPAMILLVVGCGISRERIFGNVEVSSDPEYGYTIDKPILIKTGNLAQSRESAGYFLSRLQAEKGGAFTVASRNSFANPVLDGKDLDGYTLQSQDGTDLQIFVDPNRSGEIKIPKGLKYEP